MGGTMAAIMGYPLKYCFGVTGHHAQGGKVQCPNLGAECPE
jgi:hypothetical protein